MTAEALSSLLKREISSIAADDRRDAVQSFLVEPFTRQLTWTYDGNRTIECWIVAQASDLQIFYADEGFASYHWGLASATRKWAGTDDSWFASFDEAFINSGLWRGALPDDYEVR
jgi:hypothetical protein